MTAYGNMTRGIPGLKQGLGGFVESKAAQATINFGAPVMGYRGDAKKAYPFAQDTANVVLSAAIPSDGSVTVNIGGVDYTKAYATSSANTLALLVVDIEAAGYEAVVLGGSDVGVAVRSVGAAIGTVTASATGTSAPTATVTYGSSQVFLGFALYTAKESVGDAGYFAGEAVNVLSRDGSLLALTSGAVDANTVAYLGTDGLLSGSGTYAVGRFKETTTAAGFAEVEPLGQVDLGFAGTF